MRGFVSLHLFRLRERAEGRGLLLDCIITGGFESLKLSDLLLQMQSAADFSSFCLCFLTHPHCCAAGINCPAAYQLTGTTGWGKVVNIKYLTCCR